ncbi:hypothetical protein PsorP6_011707 [Peronosclerospora sorghi]|uniref:Uncharacterized protein n=1 Tax=Peronosclerospora sorghi TaxID=230839 RepID=A0ACC0WJU3_9STRA|nr:hypothetical protein PsorP6_011707 [Peronosclerospora sorghi]
MRLDDAYNAWTHIAYGLPEMMRPNANNEFSVDEITKGAILRYFETLETGNSQSTIQYLNQF